MIQPNLEVEVAGVKFRNPVLSGASELAHDVQGTRRLIKASVGGIVSKTLTSMKSIMARPRPYMFPLKTFKGFEESGALITYAAPHVEDADAYIRGEIAAMVRTCHEAGLPFIVTYIGDGDKVEDWVRLGRMIEDTGADMLELNFQYLWRMKDFSTLNAFLDSMKSFSEASTEIVGAVSRAVKVPVGPKIPPGIEFIEELAGNWSQAGAKFLAAHNGHASRYLMVDVEKETILGQPSYSGFIFGRTFLPWSLGRVAQILQKVNIPIIGIGGIYTGADALQYILCGCPLTLMCTSVFLEGVGIIKKVVEGIKDWMVAKNYRTIEDFRGKILPTIIPTAQLKSQAPGAYSIPPHTPFIPVINKDLCNACGRCWRACDSEVLAFDKKSKRVLIDDSKCWSCGLCVGLCKQKAINLVDRKKRKEIWTGSGKVGIFDSP